MTHKSMETIAAGLAARGIATLRYQFPYMENGGKRPDPPAVAHCRGARGGRGGGRCLRRSAADRRRKVVRAAA